uniref:Uncharacterized protein n=1 Tax=Physcomitrium patens TaxID=3218 RepID=A0A7I4ET50_PHYPA
MLIFWRFTLHFQILSWTEISSLAVVHIQLRIRGVLLRTLSLRLLIAIVVAYRSPFISPRRGLVLVTALANKTFRLNASQHKQRSAMHQPSRNLRNFPGAHNHNLA